LRILSEHRVVASIFILFFSSVSIAQVGKGVSNEKIEKKIDAILSKMTVEQKIGQTCQITLDGLLKRDTAGQVIEPIRIDPNLVNEAMVDYHIGSVLNVGWHTLNLEEWRHVIDGVNAPYLKGDSKQPIIYGIDAIHGANYVVGATLFPQEIGLAATWNPSLAKDFGEVTAYETRASGVHWNFSPVLDVARQPLWSRNFETLGEDPYLASEMGKAVICGYQGKNVIDSYHVGACMKHFVGYSAPLSGRDRTPAWIPNKYMHEIFLAPFKSAVEKGALTVMINSGVVNGVPGHANEHLITDVLKNQWGFQGFAVSDWEDFIMLHTVHRTAETKKAGIIQAVNAGLDMSMVPYNPEYKLYCDLFKEAVNEGSISMERLDDAVRRILRVKMILGLYSKGFNQAKDYNKFGEKSFIELAEKSALESITLLKNQGPLPIAADKRILVAGPTSDNLIFLNGAWTHTWQGANTDFNTANAKTVKEAFESVYDGQVEFSQGAELYLDEGYENTRWLDTNDFKLKAQNSDVIVLCLGEYPSTEKPGDIQSLELNEVQLDLAKMAYRTGKEVVLVLIEGRGRVVRDIVEDADAIIQAYLPGDYGANALVKLVSGEVNFSGKLPYTYQKHHGQIEFYDHPRSVARHKANGFDAFDPQWEFGFGLSYTNFQYSNLSLSDSTMSDGDSIIVTVDVTNVGTRSGKEVVQLYLSDVFASLIPTGKSLKGFKKIHLEPGKMSSVQFVINKDDLKFAKNDGTWVIEDGEFIVQISEYSESFEYK